MCGANCTWWTAPRAENKQLMIYLLSFSEQQHKSSESPFFSLLSAPHPTAGHFRRICLTGPEISWARRDTMNIITVLCRLAQYTDKAYVGLLQGITLKTLFMQICTLRIDKTLCLKESLFVSGSSRLTGCIVGAPLWGLGLLGVGNFCSFVKHRAQRSNGWSEANQVGPCSQQPRPGN